MTAFWIMTALLASLAGWLVLSAARAGEDLTDTAVNSAANAELDELDRLKSRGLLDEASWTAARAEAGRRILAGEREPAQAVAGGRDRVWILIALALTGAVTIALYGVFGAPGLPDQAYARRVDDWAARPETLQPPQLAAVIAREVEKRPADHQALTMLGAARFEAGDPIGAVSAFRRALALKPDDARSWARLGESLVRADEGRVGADAEAAFRQAVGRDPDQLGARYFLGEAALTRGDAAEARRMWLPLIASLDAADPRRADLQRRLPGADGAP